MKKRLLSILLMCCMVLTLLPTTAFAEGSAEEPPVCSCETACTADNMNKECPVCGAENAIPQNCGQYIPVEDRTGENGSTERADDPNGPTELSAADQVQAMIDGLPNAEEITEDNAEEVKAQLEAIDEAKEKLSDEEIDELDMTRYAEAAAALGALAAPMLLANDSPDEQFSLTPGGRYYFDLSAMNIPGTVNGDLPDSTLHYVPFTYAGTIEAYKLTSEMATTEEYAQQNKYPHSLFIADYNVTHTVSRDDLNTKSLIFGKNYARGGVDYTLRAPSCGSGFTGSDDSERGTPQSNEWDAVLDKNSGYVKNWNDIYSWGQDTSSYESWYRAVRGYYSARGWGNYGAAYSYPNVGFRPVLEVLNPDELGSDGLKAVTLDLGGGKLGGSSDAIHIIVKTGSEFTAPASDGMTRPNGDTGSYFMWLGSNGKLYAPGDNVPADVTKLTAQFALSEQFFLTPGGRYYFDLSAMNIPGTANSGNSDGAVSLPDTSLHYVPFTYVGTIEAYKLTSATATTEEYAQQNKYPHSLFVADYAVTHTVSWDDLNTKSLIFGKNYASGGVDYTLRAPSVGSNSTGSGESQHDTPSNNEWDRILDKNSGYIQNWNKMYSWGQDTSSAAESFRAYRGYNSARFWYYTSSSFRNVYLGFRPVLEVLNPGTLGSDGLKVVTLDLGGGKLGNSSEDIQIIVKTGSEFTAPASDGLTRPDGDAGSFFMWLGSNGKFYAPGDSVPAEVTKLTAQWTAPTYAVTLNTNGGTINSGNVTSYTYGVGATLPTAGDMTYTGHTFVGWYDNENLTGSPVTAIGGTETGNKEYWAKWEANAYTVTLNTNGGTINSGNVTEYTYGVGATLPTAGDMTYTGHTFVGWYDNENLTGDPVTAIGGTEMGNKEYWAKWEINQYTITVKPENGKADITITQDYGTPITAPADPTREGYTFAGWDKAIPATMPAENLTITAHWSLDTYSITYNLDGGTASGNPDFYTVESSTITLNPPTRTGYTFIGWSGTDLSGSDNLTVTIPAGSIGNRSYIAHWSLNTYSITYDLDGGTALGNPDFYTVESSAITLNEPTKAGYVFTGWSGTDLVGEDNLTVTIPAGSIGDRRYTAHWEFDPTIIAALNPTPNADFLDVSRVDWFYYDVRYVCENGLMNGTSRNRFSPYGTATRGMLVTILYRMENEPRCFGSAAFSDVKPGAYYEKAVVWASQNNIVSGYTDGTFRPDAPVTREQLASILYRYTRYRGQDVSAAGTTSLTGYGGAQTVSSYALPAMRWACGTGILQGANGKLNPSGLATRAQLAAMLHRYLTK